MKKQRKIMRFVGSLLLFVCLISIWVVTIQAEEREMVEGRTAYSQGLEFTSNGDGTCYASGIGNCSDSNIIIPPISPKGDRVIGVGGEGFLMQEFASILLPEGVAYIDVGTFYGCRYLVSVTLPDSLIRIEDMAFQECNRLKSINWPSGLEKIGDAAFCATSIQNVIISGTVKYIGDSAFFSCDKLSSVLYFGTAIEWEKKVTLGINHKEFLSLLTFSCKNGHVPNTNTACTQDQTCTTCGAIIAKATGHTPGPKATCLTNQTCVTCGAIITKATGHTPGPKATCTKNQTCVTCGVIITKATGHTPGPKATCLTNQTCVTCGAIITKATGHTPGPKATCTKNQTCTVCNAIVSKKLDHTYEQKIIESTCTDSGYTILTCTRCGYSYSKDVVAADKHTPSAPATCTQNQICTVCKVILRNATGHTPGEWIIVKEPDIGIDGEMRTECTVCHAVLEIEILPGYVDVEEEESESLNEAVSDSEAISETQVESLAELEPGCEAMFLNMNLVYILLLSLACNAILTRKKNDE